LDIFNALRENLPPLAFPLFDATPPSPDRAAALPIRDALVRAEASFESIRKTLINNIAEPERSAFWEAVKGRDSIRSTFDQATCKESLQVRTPMREALEKAHQTIVLTIAFLGRDSGTNRIEKTIDGLTTRLVAADKLIRAVLTPASANEVKP
jgi:hypothetical protein